VKTALVSALSAIVDDDQRRKARRFLQGLSSDELQYIAEFLGACILECPAGSPCSRTQLAEGIRMFERSRREGQYSVTGDAEHKMILLLEYLCSCGLKQFSLAMRAAG
jgi:hypothetical protein